MLYFKYAKLQVNDDKIFMTIYKTKNLWCVDTKGVKFYSILLDKAISKALEYIQQGLKQ